MKIIDTHVHFWDLENKINNWVLYQADINALKKNFLPNTLFKEIPFDGIVHIEAHDSVVPTINEIKWLGNIMNNYPNIKYAHIAYIDITLRIGEFTRLVEEIKQYPHVKGIRHILAHNPRYKYNPCNEDVSGHKNILANLECLKQNNLVFDCQMYPYQLQNFLPYVFKSEVLCVVDHFALPVWDNKADQELWQSIIVELGKTKHMSLKLSGLDMFKPEPQFLEVLDFCLQNIPAENLVYGSNYPVSGADNYSHWLNFLDTAIKNDLLKKQIFEMNAAKLFFNQLS